jgi:hypothetical protein
MKFDVNFSSNTFNRGALYNKSFLVYMTRFTQKELNDFKIIWRKKFGEIISDDTANEKAGKLITLIKVNTSIIENLEGKNAKQ